MPMNPLFMQAGGRQMAGQPAPQMGPPPIDPLAMLDQKVIELEQWATDMSMLVKAIHPPMGALLIPIAQAGKALQQQVAEMKERLGAQSAPAAPGAEAAGPMPQLATPSPTEGAGGLPPV